MVGAVAHGHIVLGLSGCLTRLSVFGVGTMAAGLYFLLVNLGLIPSLITWPIIVGLLLVLCGLSILLEGPQAPGAAGKDPQA